MTHPCIAAIAALLCIAVQLTAQGAPPANEAQARNDCRLADQIVRTGHPVPHREWAYTILSQCSQAGPAAIAAMWIGLRHPGADEFPLLIRTTRALRDRRIYTALRSLGQTRSADVDVRLHALALLLHYGSEVPFLFSPSDLQSAPDGPGPPLRIVTHADVIVGSEAVGDVREELRAYYLELRESDPDPMIRNAARILLRYIS